MQTTQTSTNVLVSMEMKDEAKSMWIMTRQNSWIAVSTAKIISCLFWRRKRGSRRATLNWTIREGFLERGCAGPDLRVQRNQQGEGFHELTLQTHGRNWLAGWATGNQAGTAEDWWRQVQDITDRLWKALKFGCYSTALRSLWKFSLTMISEWKEAGMEAPEGETPAEGPWWRLWGGEGTRCISSCTSHPTAWVHLLATSWFSSEHS